jgi:hypothetical protein
MRKADNLPLSCAVVMKSGSLNFLEPSGSLRPRNGDCFTFAFLCIVYLVSLSCVRIVQCLVVGWLVNGEFDA